MFIKRAAALMAALMLSAVLCGCNYGERQTDIPLNTTSPGLTMPATTAPAATPFATDKPSLTDNPVYENGKLDDDTDVNGHNDDYRDDYNEAAGITPRQSLAPTAVPNR